MKNQATAADFDFTRVMRRLCDELVARLPQLAHIDMTRIAIAFNRVRKVGPYGVQASLTPLRFAGGSLVQRRGRHHWTIQRVYDESNCEMLYILRFYLPRFFDLPLAEKLCTTVHELWHISPSFDGDLRRFPGRCYAHSSSERRYDSHCRSLATKWMNSRPPADLVELLELDYQAMCRRYRRISASSVPVPKLIRLPVGPASP